ncbi:MAG: diadenylate cyclase [Actinomycetota bacterium]
MSVETTRAHERLREELEDDGIDLPNSAVPDVSESQQDAAVALLLHELDLARRPPIFEGRSAPFGTLILVDDASLVVGRDLVEVIDLDMPVEQARRFAEGRSTFLVRTVAGRLQLACFRRTIQYEADLVEVQQSTGALIVQRTVMGTPRLISSNGVIEWNGSRWRYRPSARVYLPALKAAVPESPVEVLRGLLDLATHWLSPARIGATFLLDLDPQPHDDHGLDRSAALPSPSLSVAMRHHFPAIFAVLAQTDLATLVSADGVVTGLGVGLSSSVDSESAVTMANGMRHRSAARYTWDHDHTVAFVVSEDGPVTLFRHGSPIAVCAGGR